VALLIGGALKNTAFWGWRLVFERSSSRNPEIALPIADRFLKSGKVIPATLFQRETYIPRCKGRGKQRQLSG
jgi:hypothetical protein